jgi:hypothetical protein
MAIRLAEGPRPAFAGVAEAMAVRGGTSLRCTEAWLLCGRTWNEGGRQAGRMAERGSSNRPGEPADAPGEPPSSTRQATQARAAAADVRGGAVRIKHLDQLGIGVGHDVDELLLRIA